MNKLQFSPISGRVVDAKTKDPIPFATINLREEGEGTLSNEFGYFQFTGSKTLSQDSLEFMALGYTRRTTFVEPGRAKDLLIELNRQVIFGMISCPVMPFTIFNTKTTPLPNGEILAGLSGTQYAFFIKNETGKQLGYIRAISICIGDTMFPRKPFRLGLYNVDGEHRSPGKILLALDDVERTFHPSSNGWCTIDLSYYKLVIPGEGCFASIQFFDIGNFYPRPFAKESKRKDYIIQPSSAFDGENLWSGDGQRANWTLFKVSNEKLSRYKSMIKVKSGPRPKIHL